MADCPICRSEMHAVDTLTEHTDNHQQFHFQMESGRIYFCNLCGKVVIILERT